MTVAQITNRYNDRFSNRRALPSPKHPNGPLEHPVPFVYPTSDCGNRKAIGRISHYPREPTGQPQIGFPQLCSGGKPSAGDDLVQDSAEKYLPQKIMSCFGNPA
jgi:hypothetical protein